MPVKFYVFAEAVGPSGRSRDPSKFSYQRNRRPSINKQRRHGEPGVCVGLVNVCQQHPRMARLDQTTIVRFAIIGHVTGVSSGQLRATARPAGPDGCEPGTDRCRRGWMRKTLSCQLRRRVMWDTFWAGSIPGNGVGDLGQDL